MPRPRDGTATPTSLDSLAVAKASLRREGSFEKVGDQDRQRCGQRLDMVSVARAIERSADSVRVLHHFVGIVLLEIVIVHFYIAVAVVVVVCLVPFYHPNNCSKVQPSVCTNQLGIDASPELVDTSRKRCLVELVDCGRDHHNGFPGCDEQTVKRGHPFR